MQYLQTIFLGIIQGLAEFLPISSSGHLIILEKLLGLDMTRMLTFDIAVHAGTFFALLIYFYHDIIQLFRDLINPAKWKRLIIPLFLATLPAIIIGLFGKDWLETYTRSTHFVSVMMVITALLLILTDYLVRKLRTLPSDGMKWWKALIIGLFQAIAIVPGISRSGATLTGGVITGLDKYSSARFSFLLGMIAIFGATLLTAPEILTSRQIPIFETSVGFIAALVSGLAAIWWFLRILPKVPLRWFSLYLVIAAILAWGI
ncbi:MAG: undecaprenyl-diphosphate phosphatase [Patescibacteria group bacterium]|nr:undecaprenyl-diphosphate phosphatase [Patescibacteria group bacterium]